MTDAVEKVSKVAKGILWIGVEILYVRIIIHFGCINETVSFMH